MSALVGEGDELCRHEDLSVKLAFVGHSLTDGVRSGARVSIFPRFCVFRFAGQELDCFGRESAIELLIAGHDKCDETVAGDFFPDDILGRKSRYERVQIF